MFASSSTSTHRRRHGHHHPIHHASNLNKYNLEEFSGQTVLERRQLRAKLSRMHTKIMQHSEAMQDTLHHPEVFNNLRVQNNSLFEEIKYRRELKLEGDNIVLISNQAVHQVDQLVQVPKYDPIRLTNKLKQKFGTSNNKSRLDWTLLGTQAGVCYKAVPSRVQFLHGPLQIELDASLQQRKRKQPTHFQEEQGQEENPEHVVQNTQNPDQASASERSVRMVEVILDKSCRELKRQKVAHSSTTGEEEDSAKNQQHGVNAVEFLLNPKSFTQTVENICHFSFLVAQGKASIRKRPHNDDVIVERVPKKRRREEHPPARQTIAAFTLQDFKKLCRAYQLEEAGHIPHRTGSRFDHFVVGKEDDGSSSSEEESSVEEEQEEDSRKPAAKPTVEEEVVESSEEEEEEEEIEPFAAAAAAAVPVTQEEFGPVDTPAPASEVSSENTFDGAVAVSQEDPIPVVTPDRDSDIQEACAARLPSPVPFATEGDSLAASFQEEAAFATTEDHQVRQVSQDPTSALEEEADLAFLSYDEDNVDDGPTGAYLDDDDDAHIIPPDDDSEEDEGQAPHAPSSPRLLQRSFKYITSWFTSFTFSSKKVEEESDEEEIPQAAGASNVAAKKTRKRKREDTNSKSKPKAPQKKRKVANERDRGTASWQQAVTATAVGFFHSLTGAFEAFQRKIRG